MLERRSNRFDRQGECLERELEPPAPGNRRIGDERRGAGRAVDQRSALLHLEFEVGRKLGEQRIQCQYFARAALAGGGDRRHRPAVQHLRNGLCDARCGGGVPFDEVREPGEDDAAHHPVGQIFAEGGCGRERFDAGVVFTLFGRQPVAGALAHGGGNAVDHHRGVFVDELEKGCPAGGNALHCGLGDAHVLPLPGHAVERGEIDVRAGIENDGQDDPPITRLNVRCYANCTGARADEPVVSER